MSVEDANKLLSEPAPAERRNTKVERDRWGRYVLPDPNTGEMRSWRRVTTIAKVLDNTYGLHQWELRRAAFGMGQRRDLFAQAASCRNPDDDSDKETLGKIVKEALSAAATKAPANEGTAVHRFTERVDEGELDVASIPEPWRADVEAYRRALKISGLGVYNDQPTEKRQLLGSAEGLRGPWIERIVLIPEMDCAGTLDRVYNSMTYQTPRVGDVKTGKDVVNYGKVAIPLQLALYAHATHWWDTEAWTWRPMPPIDQSKALVIHLPIGKADCRIYEVDIEAGWWAVEQAYNVEEWRKRDDLMSTIYPLPGQIEAATRESTVRTEQASNRESPAESERASETDSTVQGERASGLDSTVLADRASVGQADTASRASSTATKAESTVRHEPAATRESTGSTEPFDTEYERRQAKQWPSLLEPDVRDSTAVPEQPSKPESTVKAEQPPTDATEGAVVIEFPSLLSDLAERAMPIEGTAEGQATVRAEGTDANEWPAETGKSTDVDEQAWLTANAESSAESERVARADSNGQVERVVQDDSNGRRERVGKVESDEESERVEIGESTATLERQIEWLKERVRSIANQGRKDEFAEAWSSAMDAGKLPGSIADLAPEQVTVAAGVCDIIEMAFELPFHHSDPTKPQMSVKERKAQNQEKPPVTQPKPGEPLL